MTGAAEAMRALGLDLGSVRIGVAVSDDAGRVATPLEVIRRSRSRDVDHRAIADLAEEWEVGIIVVGLPLSLDGSVGKAAKRAVAEAERIGVVTKRPVATYDERLTTVSAHQILREQGVAGPDRKELVDMVAAAVLLQSWLDGRGRHAAVDDGA